MSNVLAPPVREQYANDETWRFAQSVYGLLTGQPAWGVPITHTGIDDDVNAALTVENQGAGPHINVPGLFLVDNSGVSIGVLNLTTLNVSGVSTLNTVNASGLVTLSRAGTALNVTNNALVNGVLTAGALGVSTTALIQGNATLGDANTDAHTVIGSTTFRNAAASATQVYVDAGNNRVIVGSGTALGSAPTDLFSVIGGTAYFAATNAIGIRASAADTVGWLINKDGAGANKDLLFLDDGGAEIVRMGDTSSTNQLKVTGRASITGIVDANKAVLNGTAMFGSEILRVVSGSSRLEGVVTITTGGLSVTAGGINVVADGLTVTGGIVLASSGNIDGNSGTAGQIRIGAGIFNAAALDVVGDKLHVNGPSRLKGAVTVTTGGMDVTGASIFSTTVSLTTGNVVAVTGAVIANNNALSGTEKLRVTGTSRLEGLTTVTTGGINVTGGTTTDTLTVNGEASAKSIETAKCSGALTLTGSLADITGCSVSLTPGEWVVTGIFDFRVVGADTGVALQGACVTTGGTATITSAASALLQVPTTGLTATVAQCWRIVVTATTTAKLQATKSGGGGSSVAGVQSTITAAFVGKP